MLKVLIWVVSNDYRFLNNAINILDRQHNGLEVVGTIRGTDFTKIDMGKWYDVLLVIGAKEIGMSKITQAAKQLRLPEEKLLGDWIVCIPGFTLDKYRRLQCSSLSIISRQCFGGCISKMLGLPFRSPFVNSFIRYEDFMKFLRAPKNYIKMEPRFEKMTDTTEEVPESYPILSLGDIALNMLHYKTAEEAIAKWNERKTRINPYNLIIITAFKDEEFLPEFDALPYGKKICFVPFKSDLYSAWYIKPGVDSGAKNFIDSVNRFGWGYVFYYDLFDMLLYGKKTPLIEM